MTAAAVGWTILALVFAGFVWVIASVSGKRAAVVIVGCSVALTGLVVWAVFLITGETT